MGYLTDIKHADQNDPSNYIYNENSNNENSNNENLNPSKSQLKYKKQCYYSNITGSYIHDAITNAKYPWKVGSFDERRFFKVTNTTGNLYNNNNNNDDCYSSQSSNYAFYETPYEYMNHTNVELDENLIKEWYEKVNKLYPDEYK